MNDFCYEKRDWMTVRPKELPGGSKLIMGLNPPFGVKGGLANMFIDKALEFKPKLLILIVPEETERLDEKKVAYDLVWEDEGKLSGKSFYLPGSIDVNDNQMEQWNVKPPRLYLWSRPNWTAEHRAIASEHGHLATNNEMEVPMEENHNENQVVVEEDVPMDISPDREGPVDISKLIREYGGISGQHGLSEEHHEEKLDENHGVVLQNQFKSSLSEIDTVVNRSRLPGGNPNELIDAGFTERLHTTSMGNDHGNPSSGAAEISPGNINEGDFAQATEMAQGSHGTNSPYGWGDAETLLDGHLSDIPWSPRNPDIFDRGLAGAGLAYGVGFGGQTRIPPDDFGDVGLKYNIPFTSGVDNWSSGTGAAHDDRGIRVSDVPSHYSGIPDEHRKERGVQLLRLYGQQNELGSSVQRNYLYGQDNGFSSVGSLSSAPYSGLAADPTLVRPNSSAMQRYAPRLDELNHTRLSPFGSGPPIISQSSIFDNPGLQYPPTSNGGIHPDTYGFAPGRRPFPF
ncbi:hypothetical protein Syun_009764 [Stephania yunnanensis]|uniref:DM2 domain-containing protein n=1 Tax=Stephania yunnanensis TaxID=152371 RepID=A0AAP0KHS0_9MAGN